MNLSISVRGWPGFWQYDVTGDLKENQHYTPAFLMREGGHHHLKLV